MAIPSGMKPHSHLLGGSEVYIFTSYPNIFTYKYVKKVNVKPRIRKIVAGNKKAAKISL